MTSNRAISESVDFQTLFEALPGNYLVFQPNAPLFTILAVSDELLRITRRKRKDTVGKNVFEIFPGTDQDKNNGPASLQRSLDEVLQHKMIAHLPVVRYDIINEAGVFEERYWSTQNTPVLNAEGEVAYIIHTSFDITSQVKAEKKESDLREIEKSYNFFMQAPVAVCIVTGEEYTVELANEEMLQFLGRTSAIVGKPILEALPEAKIQGLIDILDKVRTTGQPYFASAFPATLLINGVRELRYFDLVFKPYFKNPDDKEVSGVFCIAHHVTEQVAARNELRESEHRFRTLIEEATVATALYLGPELRIQYANDIMLGYWGKDASVIGKIFREALPELENQPFQNLLENVYATGLPYIGTKERADLVVDGKLQSYYFNFTYKALRDTEGMIYGIHHMAVDVTREVLAIQKLEEEEERTRLAVASAELGTYEVNLLTNELITSPRMAVIYGVEQGSSREDYIKTIYAEDLPQRERAHKRAFETGVLNYDGRVTWKDGSIHWIRIKGKVFYDRENTPIRLMGVVQDITEQKKFAEELSKQVSERTRELEMKNKELERSNENLEEFAHAASHDLKEPIRKIHFFTDLLKGQLSERLTDEEKNTFRRIENASQRMGSLIDDLLLYSHVSQRPHQKEEVDLNEKIRKVLEDLDLDIQQKKAVIKVEHLPIVKGYRRQLQQMLQNLVGNALKYNKPGIPPQITIRSRIVSAKEAGIFPGEGMQDQYHLIEISDNGIGFEQHESERIFQMFQRLHANKEYHGTGVGLAIVRKVVENHHGKIIAESEPGEGAIFRIYLPVD
jgi:PAS domain S-box-containing protein